MLNMLPGVDTKQLEAVIVRLAARIKQGGDWPAEPIVANWKGFRLWVGVTPKRGFRRAAITPQGKASWVVTLVDANPDKVIFAERKVMVYLNAGAGRRAIGQVVFDKRPVLRWFNRSRKGVKAC